MPIRRLRLSLIAALTALVLVTASSAAAAGTITGTVFMDFNANGKKDAGEFVAGQTVTATDIGVPGVAVKAYDAAGTVVGQATSDASGAYALFVSVNGTVRVQFTTPSGYQPSFQGMMNGTSVQFAEVGAANVNFAVSRSSDYCQDNPRLITCVQPASDQMDAFPDQAGPVSMPAALREQRVSSFGSVNPNDAASLMVGWEAEARMRQVGAVFGVGVDRTGNAYFGTYVKRHSPYGPGSTGFGAPDYDGDRNWIYQVDLATGASVPFVRLGDAQLPRHSAYSPSASFPPYSEDGLRAITDPSDPRYSDVYRQVGRAGLGDVDVTPDGSTLLAVEMTQAAPKLWSVPLNVTAGVVTAGSPTAIPIPVPTTFDGVSCTGTWHPMGIGVRDTRVLVGGVCGGPESVFVNSEGRTDAAVFIYERNASGLGFTTIAAFTLDYPKMGGTSYLANSIVLPASDSYSGLWRNWSDENGGSGVSRPKAMVSNIEILGDGGLAIALRDRFGDQVKNRAVNYESSASSPTVGSAGTTAAEVVRLCFTGSTYARETGGRCGETTGAAIPGLLAGDSAARASTPLFYGASYVCDMTLASCNATKANHPYAGIGGLATMPGNSTLWTTAYDITGLNENGVRSLGACDARSADTGTCGPTERDEGSITGGLVLRGPASFDPWTLEAKYSFYKGDGLGDLELACDAAPVQVGNRVWIDTNGDGIQNPGEPIVKGATARLFDASGQVVGTAVTDENGQYYFSSTSTAPAAGDGSNHGGGLTAGAAFTVRFDNPADYAAGGPLAGYALTTANVETQGDAVNSKATMVGGFPSISIPARAWGENDHTFDVGFRLAPVATTSSETLVAVGNYVWFDANRNGVQDAAEKPMPGVKVTLLTKDGKRARDATGRLVPVKTTDKRGQYVFDGLLPGDYRVRFETPTRYTYTKHERGTAKTNSNPIVSRSNPRVAITKTFRVYGEAKGDTVRNTNRKINAAFINPTIDAGVTPQCTTFTLDKRVLRRGERTAVVVTATLNGRAATGKRVTVKGLGVVLTGTTDRNGRVAFDVEPSAAGRLMVSAADAMPGCTPFAVPVTGDALPVTG